MADLNPETIRDFEEALRSATESLRGNTSEDTRRSKDIADASSKEISVRKVLAAELDVLTSSAIKFGKAATTASGGISKYSDSVNTLVGGTAMLSANVVSMATGFKTLVPIVGGLVKAFSFLVSTVFESSENILKAYDDLSSIGATAGSTVEDIQQLGLTAGYTYHNIENLTKPIKSLGTNLIALGGSTEAGARKFAALAYQTDEQLAAYRRMGLQQAEVTQIQADYISSTTKAGITLAKSPEKLKKDTDAYVESLVTLAALTGKSIQQQQEAMDRAMADENVNAYLAAKGVERDELLEKAANTKNEQERKALEAQAANIDGIITAKKEVLAFAVQNQSAAKYAATAQSLATDGAVMFTKTNAGFAASQYNIQKIQDLTMKGKSGVMALMQEEGAQVKRMSQTFGAAMHTGGEAAIGLQKTMLYDNKTREAGAQFARLQTEAGRKDFAEKEAQRKKDLEDKKNGTGVQSKIMETEIKSLETARTLQKAQQELAEQVRGPLLDAFNSLMTAITEMVDWVADLTGLDFGTDQDKARRKSKKLTKEIASLQKEPGFIPGGEKVIDAMGNDTGALTSAIDNSSTIKSKQAELAALKKQYPGVTGAGGATAGSAAAGGAAVKGSTPDSNKKITGIVETGKGFIIVETEDGQKQRREGTRNWRNNNPGNIEFGNFAKAKGAIGSDGRFAVFPTLEIGQQAKQDLVFGKNYINLSIADAISKYAPPTENKTTNYINQVLQATGASSTTILSELTDTQRKSMLQAIDRIEGFQVGKISQARTGGIFSGSDMGFPVELHGNELVAPLDPNSILAKMLTASPSEAESMMNGKGSSGVSTEMIAAMINKFDTMINYLSTGVDIQQKILRHSR